MSLPQPTLGLTAAEHRVPVLLPYPFPGPFDYRAPPGLEPKPGDVVVVPLNQREEVGVVWDAPADTAVAAARGVSGACWTRPTRPARCAWSG